ncbi:MAG: type II toxin-antitoxin system PemK/MazF family toxin [Candidatus Symbiothrix sp.]|nr:type II toxin-antitoxin system PemK/MazF family toxin [Candidatus Symbiothrix sp.]
MGRITQHTVYWVTLDPTQGSEIAKTRPCVVVSPNELNNHLNTVVIIPLTSTLRGYPFRVRCEVAGKQGELAVDQIRTVDKQRLNTNKSLGHLSQDEIIVLQNTINEMFCQCI